MHPEKSLVLVNLTPLVPLSLSRRGGRGFREGAKPPLLLSLPLPLLREGGQGDRLYKRGFASL